MRQCSAALSSRRPSARHGIIEAHREPADQGRSGPSLRQPVPRPARSATRQQRRAGSIAASSARSAATRSRCADDARQLARTCRRRRADRALVVQLEDGRGQLARVVAVGVVVVDHVARHDQRRPRPAAASTSTRDRRRRIVRRLARVRVVVDQRPRRRRRRGRALAARRGGRTARIPPSRPSCVATLHTKSARRASSASAARIPGTSRRGSRLV